MGGTLYPKFSYNPPCNCFRGTWCPLSRFCASPAAPPPTSTSQLTYVLGMTFWSLMDFHSIKMAWQGKTKRLMKWISSSPSGKSCHQIINQSGKYDYQIILQWLIQLHVSLFMLWIYALTFAFSRSNLTFGAALHWSSRPLIRIIWPSTVVILCSQDKKTRNFS